MKYLRKFGSVEERTEVLADAGVSILSYTTGAGMDIHTYTPIPPTNLVISCSNNTVTITADNATTIEYNTDGASTYTTYTQPFAITQTVTVYAKATNSDGSITGSQVCEYVEPIEEVNENERHTEDIHTLHSGESETDTKGSTE